MNNLNNMHYYESVNGGEPACIDEQIPFDIPDSWEWCRIGSLFNLQAGKNISSALIQEAYSEDLFPCYGGNGIRGYVKSYNREGDFPLIGRQGALCGNINRATGKFYATEHAVCVEIFGNVSVSWACLFLGALNLNKYATATAQPGLAVATIVNVMIPLPPLEDQQRIVGCIEGLTSEVEKYDHQSRQLDALNQDFPIALKKSILQHAIQGKLVPQDPNDEPASVLLERIAKERAKMGKKAAKSMSRIERRDRGTFLISTDGAKTDISEEIPFDIPDSWEWCLLSDIAVLQTGTTPSTSKSEYFGEGIPFIKPADILNDKINYHNESLTVLGAEKSRKVTNGALLMVCIGGSIGKCSLVDREVCFNQQINAASPIIVDSEYLHAYLSSAHIAKTIRDKATGTATPIINKTVWGQLLIALPPYNEQLRICERLRSIMPTLH